MPDNDSGRETLDLLEDAVYHLGHIAKALQSIAQTLSEAEEVEPEQEQETTLAQIHCDACPVPSDMWCSLRCPGDDKP